jgi:hypothetical protein
MKCNYCGKITTTSFYKDSIWSKFYDKTGIYICKKCREDIVIDEVTKRFKQKEKEVEE